MTRVLAVLALVALPAVADAQAGPRPARPLFVGGREVTGPPIRDGASALYPVFTPVPPRFSVGGGSLSEVPPILVPSGAWGGVSYPRPVYPPAPETDAEPVSAPTARPAAPPATVVLASDGTAALTVQFPATAEVWVGQKKVAGAPATEWTLTSPALKVGETHTFVLKGRWAANGKTYETDRSVTLAGGERGRLIVLSGTAAKE